MNEYLFYEIIERLKREPRENCSILQPVPQRFKEIFPCRTAFAECDAEGALVRRRIFARGHGDVEIFIVAYNSDRDLQQCYTGTT